MSQTAALIAERLAGWGFVPAVVREVFEDCAPAQVAVALEAFCRRSLGASIERSELFQGSVGSVHGLRLDDGRRDVIKAHRSGHVRRLSRGDAEGPEDARRRRLSMP